MTPERKRRVPGAFQCVCVVYLIIILKYELKLQILGRSDVSNAHTHPVAVFLTTPGICTALVGVFIGGLGCVCVCVLGGVNAAVSHQQKTLVYVDFKYGP